MSSVRCPRSGWHISAGVVAYSVACIFLAAIVRGYLGFGFSLLSITALSLVLPPSETVPSIFMLEVAASLHLLPGIGKDVQWRSLAPLTLGCFIATPAGVYLLANVPAPPLQIALAVFVLGTTFLLWCGFSLKTIPGPLASTAAGAASGFANGAFGMGGPPVVLFYFASPAGNIAGRASVIAFFLTTDLIGLAFQRREGLVTRAAFFGALTFLPPLLAGVWVGARSFANTDPGKFRNWVLLTLASLAVLTAAKGLVGLN